MPEILLGFEPQDEDAASYYKTELDDWKRRRRAVIHTVEKENKNSVHARGVVAGFRRGIYAPHVDFHVGDVAEFIEEQMRARLPSNDSNDSHPAPNAGLDNAEGDESSPKPYQLYSHIILDLPSTHTYMRLAARALRDGGTLVVFCPSVTQIAQCVQMIREYKLPLNYSNVLELGQNMVGGKSWDVRAAKIRKKAEDRVMKGSSETQKRKTERTANSTAKPQGILTRLRQRLGHWLLSTDSTIPAKDQQAKAQKAAQSEEEDRWEMVARPSVGLRIVGGGFVGIWHRKRNWELYEEEDTSDLEQIASAKERDAKGAGDAAQTSAEGGDAATSKASTNEGGKRELSSQRRNRKSVERALEQ